ncbi:hypothetical protein CK203_116073 [Vitis vinifera]|uniref:Aspartic peptidase DDI1-type domain-containing protein n=1 Tax=Vitis vinifera TaxID=29760 RepID=A0A438D5Z6_VITVI|nr:hypothetical protein CK203_116073 [Vitis vinifera]
MKGKKKDVSEEKEDRDSTVNVNPGKELIKEELMKKRTSPPFPQALHGKKGIKNASEILEYKDPGCPTILVMIGGKVVEKALLDLGARNGLMQLTFGNMTLELNIFHMSKKQITPEEEEGPEEVCIIDTLVEEHCNQNMQDKLNESLGDLEEGLSELPNVLATLQSWRRGEEILPLFNKEEGEAVEEETPKFNLKPLPVELKYTYLEENNHVLLLYSSSR